MSIYFILRFSNNNLQQRLTDHKNKATRASKFGIPIAAYVKHLIIKDVEDLEYPTFELSEKSEKALKRALKEKDKF